MDLLAIRNKLLKLRRNQISVDEAMELISSEKKKLSCKSKSIESGERVFCKDYEKLSVPDIPEALKVSDFFIEIQDTFCTNTPCPKIDGKDIICRNCIMSIDNIGTFKKWYKENFQ